jgi:ATP-dependent RNA helicase RhlE
VTTPTFADLGLAETLLRALNDAQYTHPTPIQAQSIPALIAGRDLLGLAETGTGKTAAFVLPLLQRLADEGGRPQPGAPRALILAPTRELAIQIGESIHAYGRHLRISHTVIFGGVGQRPQVNAIARGVDILVATPGRLLDLIDQRHLRLNQVRTFILDEADRMLDMGFVRDVRRILKLVPTERHSLLFSATMPSDIAQLAADILKNPVRVEIARAGKTVDRIDQQVMFVPAAAKREVLARLLQDPEMRRVIVFTRTKRGADRVCQAIEHMGVGVHAIHGNKSQGQRQSALDSFRKGFTRVLVATDIAARGIDIDDITHVVNYELPNIPESYVHRIGRTARAGAEGVAIAFCAPDEREYLRDIERLTGRRLTVVSSGSGDRVPTSEAQSELAENTTAAGDDARAERGAPPRREGRERGRPAHGARPRHGEARRGERGDAPRGERREERRHGEGHAPRHGASPHRGRDGAPRGDRGDRSERAPRGDAPHRGGRDTGERAEHRHGDGQPPRHAERRYGERPNGERPNGERPHRGRDGAQRFDRRNGDGHAPQNGEHQRSGRSGGQRAEHRNGNAPRNGDASRAAGAPNGGEPGKGAGQPWRNWTRGSGVSHGEARRDGGHGRPTRKRSDDRRRDGGQSRGRDAR